jgi:hypothetical protein
MEQALQGSSLLHQRSGHLAMLGFLYPQPPAQGALSSLGVPAVGKVPPVGTSGRVASFIQGSSNWGRLNERASKTVSSRLVGRYRHTRAHPGQLELPQGISFPRSTRSVLSE